MDNKYLNIDEHTLKDLEIFETSSEIPSLFEHCNFTKTIGGTKALKRRMEKPWSDPSFIKATQESIKFISGNRQCFKNTPTSYAIARVDHYNQEVLPLFTGEHPLEFYSGALSLWLDTGPLYKSISRGVYVSCILIRNLRRFAEQPPLNEAVGEIKPLILKLKSILARPKIQKVPDEYVTGWFWEILRLDQVFREYEKSSISTLLEIVYEIDALVSMADATQQHKFNLPIITAGSLAVSAQGIIHPFVPQAVANPVDLNQQKRILFLTGPNMAGKTTYLRAFATSLYLAHLGMGVPADQFEFVPAHALFSSISLNDNLHEGVSYFRAEALRVKAIAQALAKGENVVALLDEPFKGTNVKDAMDASLALLEAFSEQQDCVFIFSSHLIELSDQIDSQSIDRCYFEADEGGELLKFDYILRKGISNQRLGMRVLREEGVFELMNRKNIHSSIAVAVDQVRKPT